MIVPNIQCEHVYVYNLYVKKKKQQQRQQEQYVLCFT